MRPVAEGAAYGVTVRLKPCAASTSSTSAPRCRPICRSAKSSISGRFVASSALTGGSATWRTPARVGQRGAPGQRRVVVEGGPAHREAVFLAPQRVVEVDPCGERGDEDGREPGVDETARGDVDQWHTGSGQREQVGGRGLGGDPDPLVGTGRGDDVLGHRAGREIDRLVPVLAEADGIEDPLVHRLGAGVGDDGRARGR